MKPFMALGGLELGLRKPEDTVLSVGEFHAGVSRADIATTKRRRPRPRRHQCGRSTQSVNTYFYSLAYDARASFGLSGFHEVSSVPGKPTGVDLVGESGGVLPSQEWKRGRFNQPWYPGEAVIVGISQGYWVVTPLQLVQAVSIVAAEGVPHPLHLLRGLQSGIDNKPERVEAPAARPNIIKNPANWRTVQKGMIEVVNTGTAHGLNDRFPACRSPARPARPELLLAHDRGMGPASATGPIERHQVLFEAFAPADDARIAVIVALEAGRSGAHDAAPIARKILDAWLPGDQDRQAASADTAVMAAETREAARP